MVIHQLYSVHEYPSNTGIYMIQALTGRYLQTDHNACLKMPFNENLNHKETSHPICIPNQLTDFSMAQVSTERHF